MVLRAGSRLGAGSLLGQYEIIALIGSGGMGEVYRARDTKLGRDVAIKILSDAFAVRPDHLTRFHHEAHVLAGLNHPNIAGVYGLEEHGSTTAIVLELVEGPTLAGRIARANGRGLPVSEAITIARQLADALRCAHEHGIVHRDLKPANIAFTADGRVKVLDFGLARTLETPWSESVSTSPTRVVQGTEPGVLLGTVAYMSPEQARGEAADTRSDVWAFGCVLYEMLTGRAVFGGATPSDTLASVLRSAVDWTSLPRDLPSVIRVLLERTLEKEHDRRIADISTAKFLLDEPGLSAPARVPTRSFPWIAAAIVLAAVVIGLVTMSLFRAGPPAATGAMTRLMITPSVNQALTVNGAERDLAISPDGSHVAWVGNNASQLFVRALDQLEPRPVAGLGSPRGLFFSPDGRSIGFFDGSSSLRSVASNGEPVVNITRTDGMPVGASWGSDGSIVYATTNPATGLQQVPAAGGQPTVLTRPNRERGEADHRWPHVFPGGKAVLFTIIRASGGIANSEVAVLDLATGAQKTVVRGGTDARYVSSGHLLYVGANGGLWAVRFDRGRMETVGAPVLMLPQIVVSAFGAGDFDLAENGTVVYATAGGQALTRALVWVDRQGREEVIDAPQREYLNPRISPDGSRVAIEARDGDGDIWIWDFSRKTYRDLTLNPAADRYPVWTPDGSRVVFNSDRNGVMNLFWQAADGSGTPERLTESQNPQFPTAISPDGSHLVFHETATTIDLLTVMLGRGQSATPLVKTAFSESNGDISPDGRWLAYQSNESGTLEILVRPFPDVNDGRWQVSSSGGVRPVWSRNSRELFYLTLTGALMSVPVDSGPTFNARTPVKVVEGNYLFGVVGAPRTYDVSLDGLRFLMIRPVTASTTPASLVVVQNWTEELKRLVP